MCDRRVRPASGSAVGSKQQRKLLLDDDRPPHALLFVRDAEVSVGSGGIQAHPKGLPFRKQAVTDVVSCRGLAGEPSTREVLGPLGKLVLVRGDGMGFAARVAEHQRISSRDGDLGGLEALRTIHVDLVGSTLAACRHQREARQDQETPLDTHA